jgi:hypothetical protein
MKPKRIKNILNINITINIIMKSLLIELTDNFIIPKSINNIGCKEWEIILLSIDKIVNISNIDNGNYEEQYNKEKANLIELYEDKIKNYNNTITLNNNMISLNNTTYENIITKLSNDIVNLKSDLEAQFNKEKSSLIELYEERLKNSKADNGNFEEQYNKEKANLIELYEDKIKNYNNTITLNNNMISLNNTTYENIITKLSNDIVNLKSDLEAQFNKEKSSLIELYEERLKNSKADNDNIGFLVNSLNENLKPIYKFYSGTNMEKGNLGEKYILNVLSNNAYFKDAIIEDTSGQTSKGDIYFKWKKLKCLLEIKNKDYITKEDIAKFKKDVSLSSNSLYEVNSAILISLRSDNFYGQNRENIKLETINGIPHLYIYLKNNDNIEYALSYLEFIIDNKVDHSENNSVLLKYFRDYYNIVNLSIKNYEGKISTCEKELKKLYKEYNSYKDELKKIEPNLFLIDKVEIIKEEKKTEPNPEPILFDQDYYDKEKIKKAYINSVLKNQEIASIDEKVIEEAKADFLAKNITPDIVSLFKNYKDQHGGYPERKEAIRLKLIKDHVIRKIGKIFNVPNSYGHIISYVIGRV